MLNWIYSGQKLKFINLNYFGGVRYRPPNNTLESTSPFIDSLQHSINSIERNPNTIIVLLGDFNAHFDMNDSSLSSDFGVRFYHMLECNNLFQLIDEPTRITNSRTSILDLIITNAPAYFVTTGTDSPPSNCDHNFIFGKMSISFSKPKAYKRVIWSFQSVNVNELNADILQTNQWQELVSENDNIDTL